MRSSGPASASSRGTSSTTHSTSRTSASTLAWGAKSGATRSARIAPEREVALRLLAVANDLLDGCRDRPDALHLDQRHAPLRVAAPEIDGPDIGQPLPLDHGQPGLDQVRSACEMLVQLALLPLALEQRLVRECVARIVMHLLDDDRQRLVGGRPVDADDLGLLAHAGRARHVVDRLRTTQRVHRDRAVLLEEHDAIARRETRGQAPGVADRAAADEDSHGWAR